MVLGSLVLAVAWWVIWRLTTDDAKTKDVVDRATGHFLEIGLYKDHPRPMFKALWELQVASLRLGWVLLLPSLLFLIPLILVLPYLAASYTHRPLKVGESAVVSLEGATAEATLELPTGLNLEAGPLVYPTPLSPNNFSKVPRKNYSWRVSGSEPGSYQATFKAGRTEVTKRVRVGETWEAVNPRRTPGWVAWIWNPSEGHFRRSWCEEIRLDYPRRDLWVGNMRVHWLLLFLLSFIVAVTITGKLLPERKVHV